MSFYGNAAWRWRWVKIYVFFQLQALCRRISFVVVKILLDFWIDPPIKILDAHPCNPRKYLRLLANSSQIVPTLLIDSPVCMSVLVEAEKRKQH